jgi:hypothetical protein
MNRQRRYRHLREPHHIPILILNEVNKAAEENPGGEDSGEDERVGAIRIE